MAQIILTNNASTQATPAAGTVAVYTKTDNNLYVLNSSAVESQIVSSTGAVTSLAGTANQLTASASTGAVTLSIPNTFLTPKFAGGSTETIAAAGSTQGTATTIAAQYSYVTS